MGSIFNTGGFEAESQSDFLEEYDFLWLKKDRAALYAWLRLKVADFQSMSEMSGSRFLPSVPEGARYFDFFIGVNGPGPSKKAAQEVILFFENWNAQDGIKKNLMVWLENSWSEVYLRNITLRWLSEKDEAQCHWAWGYLKRKVPICSIFKPKNSLDLSLFSQAVIDGMPTPNGSELFTMKFKKAWDQQVYRRKQTGRSPLNTYISKEAKAMLDAIAEKRGEKISSVIEGMIAKVYLDERIDG